MARKRKGGRSARPVLHTVAKVTKKISGIKRADTALKRACKTDSGAYYTVGRKKRETCSSVRSGGYGPAIAGARRRRRR